jgi:hypothetical protein
LFHANTLVFGSFCQTVRRKKVEEKMRERQASNSRERGGRRQEEREERGRGEREGERRDTCCSHAHEEAQHHNGF